MRLFLLPAIILGLAAGTAHGDGNAHVVQKFNGAAARVSTATFAVRDKWEVLWFSPDPINLTLLSSDGTMIAGVHGTLKGSLYQPKGGTYYLQVDRNDPASKVPWNILVAEVASGTLLSQTDAGPIFSNSRDPNYAPPTSVLPPGSSSTNTASTQTSFGSPTPDQSKIPATPAAPPPPPVKLTADQARAVVLIQGDNAQGTGFLIKTPDGPAILTNIHVIANNPNLKITTNTGAFITVLSMKGASDRDLALLAVQDAGYSYLDMVSDISATVQVGDQVITPLNTPDSATVVNITGKILGIGPDQIDFDNPIPNRTNSGGPVFHVKSGKVLGVVTSAMKTESPDDLDKTSFASRNSALSGSTRYFGLRVDTVFEWLPIDSRRFQIETTFLDQFHEQSRRLDAYVNARNTNPPAFNPPPFFRHQFYHRDKDAAAAATIYRTDERIMKANAMFIQQASGGDATQRTEALQGLVFDLQGVADLDMDHIQDQAHFYSFDQERARDELAYRQALKDELDAIADNPDRLKALPPTTDVSDQNNQNTPPF